MENSAVDCFNQDSMERVQTTFSVYIPASPIAKDTETGDDLMILCNVFAMDKKTGNT